MCAYTHTEIRTQALTNTRQTLLLPSHLKMFHFFFDACSCKIVYVELTFAILCISLPHGWDYSTVAPWLATIKILNAQIYITFSSAVLWRAHSSVTWAPQIFQCHLQSACPPASGINQLKKTTVSISAPCFFQLTRAADHLTWSRVGPGSGLWSWSQKKWSCSHSGFHLKSLFSPALSNTLWCGHVSLL